MAATLVYHFSVAIPAGTLQAAPLVTPTVFEPNVVERIEWLFPSGCNGLVGIQIGARNVPIIPGGVGQFITRSGDSHGYNVSGMHDTGDWSVIGYNTGAFPHAVKVTYIARRKQKPMPEQTYWTDFHLSDYASMGVPHDG